MTTWRIVKVTRHQTAFDGEGARLYGGRWSSPGRPVVYTAQSASLAALEILVHLGRGATLQSYVRIACSIPKSLVARLDRSRLPAHWRSYPAPQALQQLGDEWLKEQTSAVLEVPSAIIDSESNYLLNPLHPGFSSIEVNEPRPFDFDVRLR
jgi:RES domain-containing protein